MIKLSCIGLALVLLLCAATVLAEAVDATNITYVDCPDDFKIKSIDVSDDGTFLLAGLTGKPLHHSPLMMRVNTGGEVL